MTTTSSTSEAAHELLSDAVDRLAGPGRFPVVFAGFTDGPGVTISHVAGASGEHLHRLRILPGYGLGGKAINSRRPEFSRDYGRDLYITHHYDGAILGEDIVSLFAAPVLHGDRLLAVLYGGFRRKLLDPDDAGDRVSDAASWVAQHAGRLMRRARSEENIERPIARQSAPEAPPVSRQTLTRPAEQHPDGAHRELLRSVFAELRGIRAGLREPESAERIRHLEELVAEALHEGPGGAQTGERAPSLAPRELDVLAHVALGLSNAGIAAALGLKESTVKSYLNAAMAKLDAATRHAAVSAARRLGALP